MKSKEYRTVQVIAHIFCILLTLSALMPFVLLIISSFTDNEWASVYGYSYFPKKWSLEAYRYIAYQWNEIGHAYLMSFVVTGLGTLLSIFITTTFAYGINNPQIPGMRILNKALVFTMLFNGGLVATYYSYVNIFHVKNTLSAVLVPTLVMSAFNVILVRNYYRSSIPESLIEAARIDGATTFRTFWKVIFPIMKPMHATVAVITALSVWNDVMTPLVIMSGSGMNTLPLAQMTFQTQFGTNYNLAFASYLLALLPILIFYIVCQKQILNGVVNGAVK